MKIERYVCIHGHFYQPPRENPWLEAIELQDSATPYHDWNERITAECYGPNAAARLLDEAGRIKAIVNNYSKISFNFGPTLLAWMEQHSPQVYQALRDADQESRRRFSGHGSAIAQAYNHTILPLANTRDKRTQVLWGVRDFQHRFGRDPEGMWLPETAVDLETLEVLAGLGIMFTVLAQRQADRARRIGEQEWQQLPQGGIDPTTAYLVNLPSGRSLALFFRDDLIARGVAFEGLLSDGNEFALRLEEAFTEDRPWAQLVHIATDGESYGHHHRHGEMALAQALRSIESNGLARLTNYGEYLERHPPAHEVAIIEDSSWSCAHGVQRWREDCGCKGGGPREWNQRWRAPLREALDWLRDTLAPRYEDLAARLLRDPWGARDEYIRVVLHRTPEAWPGFLAEQAARPLDGGEQTSALKLLELQRHTLLMYTSCGWFFDELSGIETVQVLRHAGRAIQLAQDLFGRGIEAGFLERLERAESNLPRNGNGRRIYEKFCASGRGQLGAVGRPPALSSQRPKLTGCGDTVP